jgi:hypothetical protein
VKLRLLVFVAWVSCAGNALAQAQPPAQPAGSGVARIGESIYKVFSAPVHPTLAPVAPGGGLTIGIGATPEVFRHESGVLGVSGRASISLKKYWSTEGNTWWQGSNRFRIEGYGRARGMRELDFYGVGNDSVQSLHSNFNFTDRSLGGTGWVRPVPWLGIGGRVEGLWPDIDPGRNEDLPSIEALFTEGDAPGLAQQPTFIRSQLFVDVNYPSNEFERARNGGDYQFGYNVYSDLGSPSQYAFRRTHFEAQQRFGIGPRPGRLTLHVLVSTSQTDEGHAVPFYLMPTLGGSHNLLAFGEQIIGGDQTIATLRGFEDFRFRDRNLLLMQAEYRFKVWGPIQATVFVDSGQVAPDLSDWALERMKRDAGFSLSLMRSDSTVLRFDFAFWSGEGSQFFMSPGRVIAP